MEGTRQDQQALPGLLVVDQPKADGTSRALDHHTSVAAGLRDLGRRGSQRERIAFAFLNAGGRGLTDEGAAIAAGIAPQSSPWKRCTELREWGYLEYSGTDRPTSTGSPAKVWVVSPAGAKALTEREGWTG